MVRSAVGSTRGVLQVCDLGIEAGNQRAPSVRRPLLQQSLQLICRVEPGWSRCGVWQSTFRSTTGVNWVWTKLKIRRRQHRAGAGHHRPLGPDAQRHHGGFRPVLRGQRRETSRPSQPSLKPQLQTHVHEALPVS